MIQDAKDNNTGRGTSGSQEAQQEQTRQGSQGGNYKNIETSVNNPASFDDDYAVKQEEAFVRDDKANDDNNRVGKGPGEGSK